MASVLFLQNIWHDYLGVMVLSASLKAAGHRCDVEIGENFQAFERRIRENPPDILAFSLMSGLHLWANGIADSVHQMQLPTRPFIIYGGPHATFFPDILAKSAADAVCIGEGEDAIRELADCIDRGTSPANIQNLWVKQDNRIHKNPMRALVDLQALPFADRSVFYRHRFFRTQPTKPFMTGRGCPYNCTFCYNKTIRALYQGKGQFVRLRAPDNVIEEILQVKRDYGLRTVYFFDDTFGLNKPWAMKLLELYRKEINLPFVCRIRADSADEEQIRAFKEAGCRAVFFAIETANERIRAEMLKKRVTDDDIYRTADLLNKHRIRFLTYNMIGIPEETIEDTYSTIQMNIRIGTSYPWCSIFSPYPGTELADYCVSKGYLDKKLDPDDLATTYHKATVLKGMNYDEINNLHKFFQLAVLMPSLFPLLRKLAKRKSSVFHTMVFAVVYFINYLRSEKVGLTHAIVLALHNMRLLLGLRPR